MFKFEKGDAERPVGRGFIYVRNTSGEHTNPINPLDAGIALASEPEGLFKVFRSYGLEMPDELQEIIKVSYRNGMEDKAKKQAEASVVADALKKFGAKIIGTDVTIKSVKERLSRPVNVGCSVFIPTFCSDHHDMAAIDGDVVRLYDASLPDYVEPMLDGFSKFYMARYFSQQATECHKKRFAELSASQLKLELVKLSGRLLYDIEVIRDYRVTRTEMESLVKGSPYERDVKRFCDIAIEKNPDKIRLMTLQMEKVLAIIDQDFETAAKKRDEIRLIVGAEVQ